MFMPLELFTMKKKLNQKIKVTSFDGISLSNVFSKRNLRGFATSQQQLSPQLKSGALTKAFDILIYKILQVFSSLGEIEII